LGSTSGELPGVMLPSTTAERAPVQEGTFDGKPCTLKNPIRAKAYASLAPDGMPQSSIVRSRTSLASSYSMLISVGFDVPPPEATTSGRSLRSSASATVREVSAVTVATKSSASMSPNGARRSRR
jgi:hypothetical protein